MPLILAIEPDRRQASRINALARHSLNVEMIVTESAERALAAISKRVPDLILTSRLLSPKDESLLDVRLRELDAAGSKVQTLMIPMLASGKDGGKKAGLLNKFRRISDGDMSDGCDPAVFAEQIAEYLDRSAADRAHNRPIDDEVTHEKTSVIETGPEAPAGLMVAPPMEPPDSDGAAVEDDPVPPSNGDENGQSSVALAPVARESWHEQPLDPVESTSTADAAATPVVAENPDALVSEFADADLWMPLPANQGGWPQLEGPAIKASVTPESDRASSARPRPPAPSTPAAKKPAFNEEWGTFDPTQCGFVALLEKLQEISE